jgi:HAD superfamily hydrolase (TIGR01509 family)
VLEALIFDVDGTLADTERQGHRVAFNRAFSDAGLNWVWDEDLYGRLLAITGGKERLQHFIQAYHAEVPVSGRDLASFVEKLQAAKTRHYTELVGRGEIQARPGVIRLIREARQAGLRLAIATTTTRENVDALLAASFGPVSPAWFEVIGAGDAVPRKKPSPDIYRHVLDTMRLSPEECLAFEDSENGLRSASAAGIPTLITVNGYTAAQDFTGALGVMNHLGEPGCPLTWLEGMSREGFEGYLDVAALRRLHGCRAEARTTQQLTRGPVVTDQ